MTISQSDRDRVAANYTSDQNLTVDDVRDDLDDADFDGEAAEAFATAIGGDQDLAASREALQSAQRQAVGSLRDGGAVGGQVVRGRQVGGSRQFTIGSPQNIEQRIDFQPNPLWV